MEKTIHPMEFVQNNISKISLLNSAPIEQVDNNIPAPQIIENKQEVQKNLSPEKISENIIKPKLEEGQIFSDIPKNSKFYQATKYLSDNSISK